MGRPTRVLLLSDPHWDFLVRQNRRKAEAWLARDPGPIDALVVAGDVANTAGHAEDFFSQMDRFTVPKFAVPGNHDYWWGPYAPAHQRGPKDFHAIARDHGFAVPDPDALVTEANGVLLFDLFYRPGLNDEDAHFTVDPDYFGVFSRVRTPPTMPKAPKAWFSVSHLAPNLNVPTQYPTRQPMFYNPDLDAVLRAWGSPVHLYGHTHEAVDATVDGVRYVNRPVGDYHLPTKPLAAYTILL